MKMSVLGRTGLSVSRVCLGSMTWGEQNSEAEGHAQMDYAVSRGINFFDTAELYPIPKSQPTQGKTEEIIGTWFQKTGKRQNIILASKVSGGGIPWIRNGEPLTGKSVREAVDGSLSRLKTDYIDLYQLHWPNRPAPHFGKTYAGSINFSANSTDRIEENLLDILTAIGDIQKAGKIRHFGLSDDSAWGIMKYIELSQKHTLLRPQSIQNEFSLLKRNDDPYVAEVCVREDVAYLPWSPLATGMLSGKYQNGQRPAKSRWVVEKSISKGYIEYRDNPQSQEVVRQYLEIAKQHNLSPTQMALKFVDNQNFVTSTIIGATSLEQLKSNIDAFDVSLSSEVMEAIQSSYRQFPIVY